MKEQESRRGFSLIEILAVISLLSLTLMFAASRISLASEAAQHAKTVQRLHDLDARARLQAQGAGSVRLQRSGSHQVELIRNRTGERLQRIELPSESTIRLIEVRGPVESLPATSLVFDQSGRSSDYEWTVRTGDRRTRIHVMGLTGWVRVVGVAA